MATAVESAPVHADSLTRHVIRRTHGRVRDLEIHFSGGCILLRGRSDTYYGKQLAQHEVLRLLPTADVQNAIEIR